eukprot:scaffold52601_cov81-Phaeocystis_antarctica.AAC.1
MLRRARRRAAPRAPVLAAGSRDSVRRARPEPQFQLRWRCLQRTVFCRGVGARPSCGRALPSARAELIIALAGCGKDEPVDTPARGVGPGSVCVAEKSTRVN